MYVGDDKYENEIILKYSFPEDIWFHVDSLSSAHVYLRPPVGCALEDIPDTIIKECAAVTKDRSIQGRKRESCLIIYTPASNVKKSPGDSVGTVYCKEESKVKNIAVNRDATKQLVKQLEKTFVHQKAPDLAKQREDREQEMASWKAAEEKTKRAELKKEAEHERQELKKRKQEAAKWSAVAKEQDNDCCGLDPDDFM